MLISDWPMWGKVLFWIFVWGGAGAGGWLVASPRRQWLGFALVTASLSALIVGSGKL